MNLSMCEHHEVAWPQKSIKELYLRECCQIVTSVFHRNMITQPWLSYPLFPGSLNAYETPEWPLDRMHVTSQWCRSRSLARQILQLASLIVSTFCCSSCESLSNKPACEPGVGYMRANPDNTTVAIWYR